MCPVKRLQAQSVGDSVCVRVCVCVCVSVTQEDKVGFIFTK